jgi:hypothetical protein
MDESKNREIMKRLVMTNDKARSSEELSRRYGEVNASEEKTKYHEKSQACHQECAGCVKELADSRTGAVSAHYILLFDFKGVKPGDPECLLASEYSKALLEEEQSSDMKIIFAVEKIEKRIRERSEERRYSEKK